MMTSRSKRLLQVETALSVLTGGLAGLTIFWRDWIEGLTGWDPDHHSGSAEVAIIIGLAALSLVLALLARRTRLRLHAATGSAATI